MEASMEHGELVGTNLDELVKDFDLVLVQGNMKQAMQESGAKSRDFPQVPIDSIRLIEGFNPRVKNAKWEAHVDGLAASMLEEGYYQHKPLAGFVAREDGKQVIYLTEGHCRFEAIHRANKRGAKIELVPMVISPSGTSVEDLTVALVHSNNGSPFESFELAVLAKRMKRWNWDNKKIAAKLQCSTTTVQNYLALMAAPADVRDMVANGVVGLHTAIEMLRTRGEKAGVELQRAAEAKGQDSVSPGGKKKVERRDVVVPSFASSVRRAAPSMFAAINDLRADTGYQSLAASTRERIDKLVKELEATRTNSEQAVAAKTAEGAAGAGEAATGSGSESEKGGTAGKSTSGKRQRAAALATA